MSGAFRAGSMNGRAIKKKSPRRGPLEGGLMRRGGCAPWGWGKKTRSLTFGVHCGETLALIRRGGGGGGAPFKRTSLTFVNGGAVRSATAEKARVQGRRKGQFRTFTHAIKVWQGTVLVYQGVRGSDGWRKHTGGFIDRGGMSNFFVVGCKLIKFSN